MERNHTMMQFFEWHVENDGKHWQRLKERAPELRAAGITSVWIPPASKGQSDEDTGYGIYDVYDLGEFDQKGTVRTKYGTKDELVEAIQVARENEIAVYADVVMNHKAAADELETIKVVEVHPEDRSKEISEEFEIDSWTKFTFPGRNGKYSDFVWTHEFFNGTDFDAREEKTGVFKISGKNKDWNDQVDDEFGNYDYLMFANIDYNHPEVREEMIRWGHWFKETIDCQGFRLDAIKHINYEFVREFAKSMIEASEDDFYMVGEFWKSDLDDCRHFLDSVDYTIDLFDVPLHYKFHEASKQGQEFDLTTLFADTLVESHPTNAVTFVDNHDSQPGESLESWVDDWFKQHAYASILLRKDGYPCVFYGDYYGVQGPEPVEGKKEMIDALLYARYHKAYGDQEDYLDDPHCVGWVRRGVDEIENSGCAVLLSNADMCEKRMFVGEERAGQEWYDYTNHQDHPVVIDEEGFGVFPVPGGGVSVFAPREVE
ncbi:alpha-amylase [Exiguobacterium sp. TDN 0502]|uniref:alpha-amylase n=1 Tax=Exiguobacterium sp. TDN 0502 TaxID=3420731 RepID=UPI003D76E53E